MPDTRGIRVLIAEDEYFINEMIRCTLEDMNYTVVGQAKDGYEAVEMTLELKPDVILMDIRMPGMDGIKASQRLNELCPTPIVVLTAYETPELLEEVSHAGAGAYLIKPSDAREIERAITIAISRFADMLELRRMNASLQAINAELDAFAHTVSHNLQNPLYLIIGFSDALLNYRSTMSEAEFEECLTSIIKNAYKMSNITNELLLLTQVRRATVTMTLVDMDNVIANVKARLVDLIGEQQAEIIVPPTWPEARGYDPWLEEVWVNYVSNALKYGGKPPQVELGATALSDGMIRFWVHDNGQGIPLEEQKRLFEPFEQLSQVRLKGHGLGLSIVRRIVEKLNGQVGVESEVGKGSTFYFTLPAADKGSLDFFEM